MAKSNQNKIRHSDEQRRAICIEVLELADKYGLKVQRIGASTNPVDKISMDLDKGVCRLCSRKEKK